MAFKTLFFFNGFEAVKKSLVCVWCFFFESKSLLSRIQTFLRLCKHIMFFISRLEWKVFLEYDASKRRTKSDGCA